MSWSPSARFHIKVGRATFTFFKRRLNRPAQPADPHQFGQGDVGRRMTQVKLDFTAVGDVAADDEPDFRPGQTLPGLGHAQEGKVTNKP